MIPPLLMDIKPHHKVSTVKFLNFRTPETFAVICLKFKHKAEISQKVLVIPRKRWFRPDMTEKLFTGMLSKKETKRNENKAETLRYFVQKMQME